MPVFRALKIPKRIRAGDDLELKLLTVRSWPLLYKLLKEADVAVIKNLGFPGNASPLKIVLLSIHLFSWAYIIRYEDKPIGMLGIYHWQPGVQLFITLAVFKKKFRNKGLGSCILKALTRHLRAADICIHVLVEVKKDNVRGLNFWKKNGFRVIQEAHSTIIMKREP